MLSQYSGDAIGHANLGFLLAATGQVELAGSNTSRPLALRPNLALAQRALAQLDRGANSEQIAASDEPKELLVMPPPPVALDGKVVQTSAERPRISLPRRNRATSPPVPSSSLP